MELRAHSLKNQASERNFFELAEKELQIYSGYQKVVATHEGDNAANPLVLGNDNVNE